MTTTLYPLLTQFINDVAWRYNIESLLLSETEWEWPEVCEPLEKICSLVTSYERTVMVMGDPAEQDLLIRIRPCLKCLRDFAVCIAEPPVEWFFNIYGANYAAGQEER